jgi:MYXO-CTERM domain-containing protein
MSKLSITRACAAATLVATSSTAFAQENTANTVNAVDPALNTTADPLANDTSNVIMTDPLANDPLATTADPLAADPMLNEPVDDDDDGGRFPWGLLGLLGLAGLLGGKRRDDVRVDTTRDTR